jgi:Na+-transporting methylmalonyl-CoA/oxaloacetate decarboxylase gamma subunit
MLAAQFGWAPGFMWLLAGCCLAGAVHDSIVLWASVRRGGRSLAEIVRSEIGTVAGITAVVAVLFILVIALARPTLLERRLEWGRVSRAAASVDAASADASATRVRSFRSTSSASAPTKTCARKLAARYGE